MGTLRKAPYRLQSTFWKSRVVVSLIFTSSYFWIANVWVSNRVTAVTTIQTKQTNESKINTQFLIKRHILFQEKDQSDNDLVASSQAKHQVKSRLLLNVVVRQGSSVLQLLASKDESLLV